MTTQRTRRSLLALATVVFFGACDDQLKYIPVFSTMSWQPSVEAFEEAPRPRPAGTMAIDGERQYTLFEADSLLVNPTAGTAEELEQGAALFATFCTPCHGPAGAGDGSVVGPNRFPPLPTLNLTSDLTRGYSDGYLWGMITNGRGVMPAYKRIPADERWLIVNYVRQLQRDATAGGDQ